MRRLRKALFIFAVILAAASGSFCIWLSNKYTVPILVYHSVNYAEETTGITVDPDRFERQMAYLKDHHHRVISLDELVGMIREKKDFPPKSVVITFDDGYVDNYVYAFPILKKYGFSATIFVITDLVDKKGYITWDQLKEMEKSGITVGSHTLDHTYLPGVSEDWQRRQIFDSKKIIEQKLGHPIDYMAYPNGGFSKKIKKMVQEAGYKGACTTNRGLIPLNKDIYELKRIRFKNKDPHLALWIKLSGYYNFFKTPRDPN